MGGASFCLACWLDLQMEWRCIAAGLVQMDYVAARRSGRRWRRPPTIRCWGRAMNDMKGDCAELDPQALAISAGNVGHLVQRVIQRNCSDLG